MILSKACNYGLRAALYIAQESDRISFLSIKEIAEQLDISFHFLTKILQTLSQKGLLRSLKGPKGGIAIAKPADEITLADIVLSIDGPDLFTKCLLGLNNCGTAAPCPVHEKWVHEREQISKLFFTTTLAELADQLKQNQLRLADATAPLANLTHQPLK